MATIMGIGNDAAHMRTKLRENLTKLDEIVSYIESPAWIDDLVKNHLELSAVAMQVANRFKLKGERLVVHQGALIAPEQTASYDIEAIRSFETYTIMNIANGDLKLSGDPERMRKWHDLKARAAWGNEAPGAEPRGIRPSNTVTDAQGHKWKLRFTQYQQGWVWHAEFDGLGKASTSDPEPYFATREEARADARRKIERSDRNHVAHAKEFFVRLAKREGMTCQLTAEDYEAM
jgi:hypothetical protein